MTPEKVGPTFGLSETCCNPPFVSTSLHGRSGCIECLAHRLEALCQAIGELCLGEMSIILIRSRGRVDGSSSFTRNGEALLVAMLRQR